MYVAHLSLVDFRSYAAVDLPLRLATLVDAYDSGLEDKLTDLERLALPLAIARQPLWAAGKWLASLDDEKAARRLAAAVTPDVAWALSIMQQLLRWQAAFLPHR